MHCASRWLNASAPPSSSNCCAGLILANDWICWAESFCNGSSHMHTQYWATSVPSGSFRLRLARSCCHLGACGTFCTQLCTMAALALGLLMPHWLRKKKPANNRAITRSQITMVLRFFCACWAAVACGGKGVGLGVSGCRGFVYMIRVGWSFLLCDVAWLRVVVRTVQRFECERAILGSLKAKMERRWLVAKWHI